MGKKRSLNDDDDLNEHEKFIHEILLQLGPLREMMLRHQGGEEGLTKVEQQYSPYSEIVLEKSELLVR